MEALRGPLPHATPAMGIGSRASQTRSLLDTDDVVQDALLNTFRRLEDFQPARTTVPAAYAA